MSNNNNNNDFPANIANIDNHGTADGQSVHGAGDGGPRRHGSIPLELQIMIPAPTVNMTRFLDKFNPLSANDQTDKFTIQRPITTLAQPVMVVEYKDKFNENERKVQNLLETSAAAQRIPPMLTVIRAPKNIWPKGIMAAHSVCMRYTTTARGACDEDVADACIKIKEYVLSHEKSMPLEQREYLNLLVEECINKKTHV
jgi:hypothetical protein